MIRSPGHGIDVVDIINACDKHYRIRKMFIIDTLEVDYIDSRMNTHSMIGSASCSLAKECKRLCDDEVRVNGVKGYRKHKKREDIQKLKKRVYHLQDKDDVEMVGIKKIL